MGNTGLRKLILPLDYVENKYSSLFELKVMDLDKNEINLNQYREKTVLIVNVGSKNVDF